MTRTELRTYYNTALPVVQRWLYLVPFVVLLVYQQMLWCGIPLFGRSLPEYVDHVEFFAMNLLMFRVFFFQKMSIKQAIIVGFMTVLVYISSLRADNRTVLLAWVFIIAAKDQDFEELVRIAFWILLSTSLLLIGLCLSGVIEDTTLIREKADSIVIRHSLGFSHPNALGIAILHTYSCFLYLRKSRITWIVPVIGAACIVFAYLVPNSMSACICSLMLTCVSLILLLPLTKLQQKILGCCAIAFIIFCNLFSVVYSLYYYELPFASAINAALTHRPASANAIYAAFGITPLGNILPPMFVWTELNGEPFWMPWLDSSYMDLMLRYGLLIYLLYSTVYLAAAFRSLKKGNMVLLYILAVYAAHGIMENSLYILRFSVFPLAIAAAIYGNGTAVAKSEKSAKMLVI